MRYQISYTVRNNTGWSHPVSYGQKRSEVVWLCEALTAHEDFAEGSAAAVFDTQDNTIAALYIKVNGKAVLKIKDNCPFDVVDVDLTPITLPVLLEATQVAQ